MKLYKICLIFFIVTLGTGPFCEEEKVHPGGIKCSDVPMLADYNSIKADLKKMRKRERQRGDG